VDHRRIFCHDKIREAPAFAGRHCVPQGWGNWWGRKLKPRGGKARKGNKEPMSGTSLSSVVGPGGTERRERSRKKTEPVARQKEVTIETSSHNSKRARVNRGIPKTYKV